MRYHLRLSEWPSSINQQTTSAGEGVKKKEPLCTVGGNADWCSHVETRIVVSQKNKSGFALRPRDFTSGNISEETQNTNLKEYMHPYDHCSIIYNCQDMEAAQVSTDR